MKTLKGTGEKVKSPTHREQLKKALRENLRKRRAQAKARRKS
ncbi:MAG TPA: hypothetical protein VD713_01420 [Sphingomonadales bacterium]|nr:hypothetical protein [Sphingomonadales bacterium]